MAIAWSIGKSTRSTTCSIKSVDNGFSDLSPGPGSYDAVKNCKSSPSWRYVIVNKWVALRKKKGIHFGNTLDLGRDHIIQFVSLYKLQINRRNQILSITSQEKMVVSITVLLKHLDLQATIPTLLQFNDN